MLACIRRERESEYRKGIPPMFGKADLQEVEKYLPHLRGCSFREEVALALPKVKNVEELARECAMSVNTLGRRFREELNTTPHRWLTEQRKVHVVSLLAVSPSLLNRKRMPDGTGAPGDFTDFGILFRFRSEGLTARSRLADNPNTAVKIQNARFPTPR